MCIKRIVGIIITKIKKTIDNKLELKCVLGQTHGFRENFRFNHIIIDGVTIIFYNKGCSCS